MNDTLAKVLTGVSLAAVIALAVPLGLMTAKIVQGESPRQLAAKAEDTAAVVDTAVDPVDNAPQPEGDGLEDGVKPLTVGEEFGIKPQVEPDPKLSPEPEPVSEAEPEPQPEPEPVKQEQPASVPKTETKTTAKNKQSQSKSAARSASTTANTSTNPQPAPEPESKSEPEPVQQTPAPVPQPLSNPNEVPSMVPDFNTYEQAARQAQSAVQQAASYDGQYVPSIFGDEAYIDSLWEQPSGTQNQDTQVPDNTTSSGNNSGGNASSGTSKHNFNGRLLGSSQSNKYHNSDCRAAQNILDENMIWFDSVADATAKDYSPCGICYK